jgi:hypothetical protein
MTFRITQSSLRSIALGQNISSAPYSQMVEALRYEPEGRGIDS